MKTLSDIGELGLIERLKRLLPTGDSVSVGIGDDCAVTRVAGSKYDFVYTTDAVIEGTHFRSGTEPSRIGHKAVGRVLSDIAAMGGEPQFVLINLVAARETTLSRVEGIYRGAARMARRYGAAIIGGDTSTGRALELHVFGVGRLPKGKAVLRSGAKPGDIIYVTGTLGGSIRGKHLDFEPRVREGQWLRGWATAMIDLSDGLATDLAHLVESSGVGASVDPERIPLSLHARNLTSAISDGEDFELLFTIPAKKRAAFERAWRRSFGLKCTAIGTIKKGNQFPFSVRGFAHFRT